MVFKALYSALIKNDISRIVLSITRQAPLLSKKMDGNEWKSQCTLAKQKCLVLSKNLKNINIKI